MTPNNRLVTLLTIGTWIGLVLGLSFIEAPIKFTAPGITIPLGLGIGKLVFGILNKIEIVFAIVLLIMYAGLFKKLSKWHLGTLITLILIVAWQSIILLPALDARADMVVAGQSIKDTYHHVAYIVAEVVKFLLLFTLFVQTFRFDAARGK